jgi:SAM-dependent methyltransferase
MLILSGFSEDRSFYCKKTSYLRAYGWVLSPSISYIKLVDKNNIEIKNYVNIENKSIWNSFGNKGNKICGWEIEEKVEDLNLKDATMNYFDNDNNLIFSQNISINFNIELENYLESFEIIEFNNDTFLHDKIKKEIKKNNLKLIDFMFDETKYFKWFNYVNYNVNYPDYCKEFSKDNYLHTKALQHYISIELLDLKEDDIYIDIASSQSVCPDIIKRYYTKNIYRQDLRYAEGIAGEYVGSNGDNIPLESDSVTKITLHCSIEHFENNSDIGFLEEAFRILKKGGKIVITPLYMSLEPVIFTSPSIWNSKYKDSDSFPKFTQGYNLILDENIKQRQEKYFSPKSLIDEIIEPFKEKFDYTIFYIDNMSDKILDKFPRFTLVLVKK